MKIIAPESFCRASWFPIFLGLLFGVVSFASSSQAQGEKSFHLATGASLGLQIRKDYGEGSFKRIYPELVVLGYVATPAEQLWIRPGFRLAYVTEQPEMPRALRLEERDLVSSLELGVVYDWYVIPSLHVGGGMARRSIVLKTAEPVEKKESINTTESLYFSHYQFGVGFPFGKGLAVAEPFYRYSVYSRDNRISSHYGIELTFQIF